MFVCTGKSIYIRNPGLFHNKYSIGKTDLANIKPSGGIDLRTHNSLDYSINTLDDGRLYANENIDKAKAKHAEIIKLLSEIGEELEKKNKTE